MRSGYPNRRPIEFLRITTLLILSALLLASAGAASAERWVAITLFKSVDATSIQVLPSGLRRAKVKEDCAHTGWKRCESMIRVELFDCQGRAFTIESVEVRQTDGTTKREGRPPSMPSATPPPWFRADGDPTFDYVCAWKSR